jgi:hypothetical protein
MAKNLLVILIMLLPLLPGTAFPDETSGSGEAASQPASGENGWYSRMMDKWSNPSDFIPPQHLTLKPEYLVYGGYRFVGLDGSRRASQYDSLRDSFAGGLTLHYYPLPWRFEADFDYKNSDDHDAHVGIDYSDLAEFSYRNMSLTHNLDHQRLIATGAIDSNPNADFFVVTEENELKLVLKDPVWPHRTYVTYREWEKSGTIQQRWNPDSFTNATRSDPRNIDWMTRELNAGLSFNLKYLEIDYHHTLKTFDSISQASMLDRYTNPAGSVFQHNLVPDLTSNYDTLSLHSDQSKAVSASGTFTLGNKRNEFSDTRMSTHREYGDISYRPYDNLFFAVKYGHQKLHAENPGTVQQVDYSTTTPTITTFDVANPPISQTKDRGTASVMYYPFQKLGILGEYMLDAVERTNADVWSDPDNLLVSASSSTTHTGKLSVTYTPERHTKIRTSFSYSRNEHPSYHTDYMNAYNGFLWGTWVPTPGLTVNGQYKILRGNNPVKRTDDSASLLNELDSRVEKDSAGAGVTWFALKGLVLGAHYDYLRLNVRGNLIYENGSGDQIFALDTPYWDTSHAYTIFVNYCFSTIPINLEADFCQDWSRGMYRLGSNFVDENGDPTSLTLDPSQLDSLTDQKIRETRVGFKASYEFYKGWGTTLAYRMSQFRDLADVADPVTGDRDGTAHIGTVLLTKKW